MKIWTKILLIAVIVLVLGTGVFVACTLIFNYSPESTLDFDNSGRVDMKENDAIEDFYLGKEPDLETPFIWLNDKFYNPVQTDPYLGDPWMIYKDGYYYFTRSTGVDVIISKGTSMTGLMFNEMTRKRIWDASDYGLTDIWAPELHFFDGHWYIITCSDTDNNNILHRVCVLKSKTDDAMGEWEFKGELMLPDGEWSIDATYFEYNGQLYCIWSGWLTQSDAEINGQYLFISPLDAPDKATEGSQRVAISVPEYDYEKITFPINEGPVMITSPLGTHFLVYSASASWDNGYCLSYLRFNGGDPMNPADWIKATKPLLESDDSIYLFAPGHNSFTKSPDGTEDWLVYHSAKYSKAGWDRHTLLQKLEWVDDAPYISAPISTNEAQPLPSGEVVNRKMYYAEDAVLSSGTLINDRDLSERKALGNNSSAKFIVSVEAAGYYGVMLRTVNDNMSESENIRLGVNSAYPLFINAPPTRYDYILSTASAMIYLEKGQNEIEIATTDHTLIESIILDMTVLSLEQSVPALNGNPQPSLPSGAISLVDEKSNWSGFAASSLMYRFEPRSESEIIWTNGKNGDGIDLGKIPRSCLSFDPAAIKNADAFTFNTWIYYRGRGFEDNGMFLPADTGNVIFAMSGTRGHFKLHGADADMPHALGFTGGIYDLDVYNLSDVYLPTNAWTMLTLVINGSDMILYVNGTAVATAPQATTVKDLDVDALKIGSSFWNPPSLNAIIDNANMWTRELSPSEIMDLYSFS